MNFKRRLKRIEEEQKQNIVQPDDALAKSFGDWLIGMTNQEALDSVFGRIKEMRQKYKNGAEIKTLRKEYHDIII